MSAPPRRRHGRVRSGHPRRATAAARGVMSMRRGVDGRDEAGQDALFDCPSRTGAS